MGFGYYGIGFGYYGIVIVSLILGGITQAYIRSQYKRWGRVPASTGETGAQVAQRMLNDAGATDVGITSVEGTLTDNYDPRDNKLHLSRDNLTGGSVASVAVACHEAGHAVQRHSGYAMMRFRTALVPVVNLASNVWMVVFFLGVSMNVLGFVQLAVVLFGATVLFQLVTLPVEFDASRRAVRYIEGCGLDEQALRGAKAVLTAAALTYVAAALVSILQLAYIVSSADRR